MAYKYSAKINENCAKAMGVSLHISRKHGFAICKALRGLALPKAKKYMEDVLAFKRPIPFTKFTDGVGHKPGIAAGRYPVKACSSILKMLNSVEANAQFKGLSTANLIIKHIVAQKAAGVLRSGRRRREAKRNHIEIIVEEIKKKAAVKKSKKKTVVKKPETKIKTEVKTEPKEEIKQEIKKIEVEKK